MASSNIGVSSSLKRSHNAAFTSEEGSAKKARTDEGVSTLFAASYFNPENAPLSSLLATRELGIRPINKDPRGYFERGKALYERGHKTEGAIFFDIAKTACLSESKDTPDLLISIAKIEYWNDNDAQVQETLKILEKIKPSYGPFAALFRSLCSLDSLTKCAESFNSFRSQWTKSLIIRPSQCLLNEQEYNQHLKMIEHATVVFSKKTAEEERPEIQLPFRIMLCYLYLFQNKIEEVYETVQDVLPVMPEFGNTIQVFGHLKEENGQIDQSVLHYIDRVELNWDGESSMPHSVCLKLLYNKALKNSDRAGLSCALRHFQHAEPLLQDPDQKLFLQSHLFACYFALKQYENALNTARRMDGLRPGSALLQKILCRVALSTNPKLDVIEDLQHCLKTKDPINADPAFLMFVGLYLSRKSLVQDSYAPVADGFYDWSRRFHRS
ncbi:MAG TPA: hypothetical protein VIJ14_05900 [Rhabdochlamydiaceae bacterium]